MDLINVADEGEYNRRVAQEAAWACLFKDVEPDRVLVLIRGAKEDLLTTGVKLEGSWHNKRKQFLALMNKVWQSVNRESHLRKEPIDQPSAGCSCSFCEIMWHATWGGDYLIQNRADFG